MTPGKEAARVFLAPIVSVVLLFGSAAWAVQPGDLLVPEFSAGSVVNIRGGGDFTGTPRFATGLTFPVSLCVGPGGDLFVSASSNVFIITAGGDFAAAVPFATGVPAEQYLACTDTEILSGTNVGAEVFDITAGGDFSAATPFAEGLGVNLLDLFHDSNGTLWALNAGGDLFDITAGGDFSLASPFAFDTQAQAVGEHAGMLLVASTNQLIDATLGGDLTTLPVFGSGIFFNALLGVPGIGLFAATGNGSGVFEVSAGGDLSGLPPFATGVDTVFGIADLVFVKGCGDGVVDPGEECDDGNTQNGDTCDAMCTIGVPEPAHALLLVTGALVLLGVHHRRASR
jgi:cysteine-rich repeat protein